MHTKTKPADLFFLRCKVDGLRKRTIETYERVLSSFESHLNKGVEEVTESDLRGYFFSLNDRGLSPTTIAIYYRHLKAYLNFLVKEGVIEKNPISQVAKPRIPRQFPYVLEEHQVEALLNVAGKRKTFEGIRDYAILLTFLDCGLRLSELRGLNISDVNLSNRSIQVKGKGGKERVVFMGAKLTKALHKYLEMRGYKPYQEALFITRSEGRISIRQIADIITKIARKAKIEGVRMSPHTLRHTFATSYIRNGGDPFSLQKLLGHSSMEIVMVYVHAVGKNLREAHARYSPIDNLDR